MCAPRCGKKSKFDCQRQIVCMLKSATCKEVCSREDSSIMGSRRQIKLPWGFRDRHRWLAKLGEKMRVLRFELQSAAKIALQKCSDWETLCRKIVFKSRPSRRDVTHHGTTHTHTQVIRYLWHILRTKHIRLSLGQD